MRDGRAQRFPLAGGIEAAFRRSLGPPLGHDAGGVRSHHAGNCNHFARRRHFQVERLLNGRLQPRDVVIDDVAAILAQMRGDAVGASRDRNLRSPNRIRMFAAASITHSGDVIYVHAEAEGGKSGHAISLAFSR